MFPTNAQKNKKNAGCVNLYMNNVVFVKSTFTTPTKYTFVENYLRAY